MDKQTQEHAFLSPSSAARWLACPRAPWLEAAHPRTAGAAAQEGTDAHQLAELSISGRRPPVRWIGEILRREKAPEESFTVTTEMAEAVQVFYDFTASYRTEDWLWSVESRVVWLGIKWPKDGCPPPEGYGPQAGPPLWGTCDFRATHRNRNIVVGFDYKHGKGKLVTAENNAQLAVYNLQDHHLPAGITRTAETVLLGIVQPRCGDGEPDLWEMTPDERDEWHARIRQGAERALRAGPTGPYGVGEGCDWCGGRRHCDGWVARSTELATLDFQDAPDTEEIQAILAPAGGGEVPSVAGLSNERLAQAFLDRQVLIKLAEALEAETWRRVRAGDLDPHTVGLKAVRGRQGNRRWTADPARVEALLAAGGIDPRPQGLKSPAQVEKELGKGALEILGLDELTGRDEGRLKLVAESARGKAVPLTTIEEEFLDDDDENQEWEGDQ